MTRLLEWRETGEDWFRDYFITQAQVGLANMPVLARDELLRRYLPDEMAKRSGPVQVDVDLGGDL